MRTRNAWIKNLANPNSVRTADELDVLSSVSPAHVKNTNRANNAGKVAGHTNGKRHIARATSRTQTIASPAVYRSHTLPRLHLRQNGSVRDAPHSKTTRSTCDSSITETSHDDRLGDTDCDRPFINDVEVDETGYREDIKMADSRKPQLKLRLSTSGTGPNPSTAQSPAPPSATRTPSIKLSFKPSVTPQHAKNKKEGTPNGASSAKKRKRQPADEGVDAAAPKEPKRRLTLKTGSAKTPVTPGPAALKLKTKGKIPKRLPGSGYDSELEEREVDPVIIEGLILRMPEGPDCDYVRNAITTGTVGVGRGAGGADIRLRFLDQGGRRGIIIVNGNQYAMSVVDLPCIIEGMKSWDKKGWIKSMDVSQMMLVLGRCSSDDEARNYPLPPDVDAETNTYEHGLTAPMKWVRKRRFARTRRARLDDIESIERKVQQLIEADKKAFSTSYQVFDHDPRLDREQYSGSEFDDDAEGEVDEGDYFAPRNGYAGGLVETPGYMGDGQTFEDQEIGQEEVDEFTRLLMEEAQTDGAAATNGHTVSKAAGGLTVPQEHTAESSIAVTSASPSPAPFSGAPTPGPEHGSDQPPSSDDEESDADDDSAADDNDKDEDADDNLQQVKDRIADMEAKIREQTAQLRHQKNAILRKKLATKIQALRDDVDMMRKQNGLDVDGEDGDGGDD